MATSLGNILISNVAVGSSAVTAIALGSMVVWQGGEEPPAPIVAEPLCFTRIGTFNTYVQLIKTGSPEPVSLEYSTDGESWTDYEWNGTQGTKVNLSNLGDKVYFRAKTENQSFNRNSINYYKFTTAGWSNNISITGNIQSLLKADCSRTDAPAYCYFHLFEGRSEWASAPSLPAMTLDSYCYCGMFQGSTSLTTAPALPATTLPDNCYNQMFKGCTSLSSVDAKFTDWNAANNSTLEWLKNVASSGTFTCPAGLDTTTRDASHVPDGWTVVNT